MRKTIIFSTSKDSSVVKIFTKTSRKFIEKIEIFKGTEKLKQLD